MHALLIELAGGGIAKEINASDVERQISNAVYRRLVTDARRATG